jgi:hypothetical protein
LENHEGFREIQEIHGNPEWETHRSSMDYRKIWNGRYEKFEGNPRKILRDSREIYGGQGQICIKNSGVYGKIHARLMKRQGDPKEIQEDLEWGIQGYTRNPLKIRERQREINEKYREGYI